VKTPVIVTGVTLATAIFTYYGLDSHVSKVSECIAITEKYVQAEFSETTLEPYTYPCGNGLSCSGMRPETYYWDEKVSDSWTARTVNGKVEYTLDHGFRPAVHLERGFYTTDYPPVYDDFIPNIDFDRFSEKFRFHGTTNLSDGSYVSLAAKDYLGCLVKLNSPVEVNTWYGIQYSANY